MSTEHISPSSGELVDQQALATDGGIVVGYPAEGSGFSSWAEEKLFMGQSFGTYLRSLVTPFNLIAGCIVALGLYLTFIRFTQGLAATTNLDDNNPWGIWIGFDVLFGVATAAGGYTLGTTVYILRLKEYQPLVRPAVLTGFLGYFFVVVGLCFDLGRPWRLPYPMLVSYGVTSVMFLIAWHVALYLSCQFVEICPALFEWLNWKRFRAWAVRLTFGATIFGVMLSTLHQSALGALFLMAPTKLHPLWYSPLLPLFFFVSSIYTGLSMVILESTISHRVFKSQVEPGHEATMDKLIMGLAKAAAVIMFTYFGLKMIGVMHSNSWGYLPTPMGTWFLIEVVGLVLFPCFLYLYAVRSKSPTLVRVAAAIAIIGTLMNRLNVAVIALNWDQMDRYVPRWSEIAISIAIVTVGILVFRWIVNRMPVLHDDPAYEPED